jgi:glycosyltransferase involved in cell wall biosynthesis
MTAVVLAANNGEIGGGEVMLLAVAEALRTLGHDVQVVAPRGGRDGVAEAARAAGFAATDLSSGRRQYIGELRAWRATNAAGILWCNGLVPAFATAGLGHRIVHLHQEPVGVNAIASRVARRGALVTLVPSESMAASVPGSRVLWNWVEPVATHPRPPESTRERRIGFLGRHSVDKGLVTLAAGLAELDRSDPGRYHLLLAGEGRFAPPEDTGPIRKAMAPVEHLVERPGWISREDFFSSIDVAVFPSQWAEPFGLVVAEAMSSRTPFVISDAGALAEVAGPAHPWVSPKGDAVALAHAVESVFEAGPDRMVEVLDHAHARWEEHFSPAAGLARVAALVSDLGL